MPVHLTYCWHNCLEPKGGESLTFSRPVQGVPYGNARVFWSVKTWVGPCGAASSFGLILFDLIEYLCAK